MLDFVNGPDAKLGKTDIFSIMYYLLINQLYVYKPIMANRHNVHYYANTKPYLIRKSSQHQRK